MSGTKILWGQVIVVGLICEWRSNSPHLWHLKIPQFS